MPGGRHKVHAEPLDVIDRIGEGRALPFAGVARTRIHLPDPERPFKNGMDLLIKVDDLQFLIRRYLELFREPDRLLPADDVLQDFFNQVLLPLVGKKNPRVEEP